MEFLHVRHATSLFTYHGSVLLIDPVLSPQGVFPPIPLTPSQRNNPLVDLSTPQDRILAAQAVLSTHTHRDHFDAGAQELLPKTMPILCQREDAERFTEMGFRSVLPIDTETVWQGISITRVNAQHGTGVTGEQMGIASGYILSAPQEPTVYFTGDTIYNDTIRENIIRYQPDILIINGGSPKFLNSSHIVMNIIDIEQTIRVKPELSFVIVHLDTFNHCMETRSDLKCYFTPERLSELGVSKFYIPADNECLRW